ncbi:hypothetical protein ACFPA8_02920 [Streptomyces ovatisporus]|uniref:Secreted protein n=1 Tax=Streptomyces ovatisporus TaxID=1128682 RepID=A0ABV8ZZI2_9ACTN
MSPGRKIAVVVVAGVLAISTPFFWLLDSPGTGQLVGASVQGATGIAALVWALLQSPAAPAPKPADTAVSTGRARATAGGTAVTGVRRPRGAGRGSASAERTGDATADGGGSSAASGIDYS